MKTTIENLEFPSDIKKRLKMKVSTTNLNIEFLSGHIIKFNQTNISVREPHRIIVNNSKNTLIFPHFYEERDLCKFASDTYFTTMKFEDIMLIQIDKANEYFVHTGNSYQIGISSPYILEKVTKYQMKEFVVKPEKGEKIYRKFLNE